MSRLGDMEKMMVCPDCDRDVPVIDTKIVGRNIVTTGHCIEDGEVEVIE